MGKNNLGAHNCGEVHNFSHLIKDDQFWHVFGLTKNHPQVNLVQAR